MECVIKPAYDSPEEVRKLFAEYTRMLIELNQVFGDYLQLQNYDEEVRHLEVKYGPPKGRLYLAYWGEDIAGCIGLKDLDGKCCEMKRLYVRPEFRGKGIAGQLIRKILKDAKTIGYEAVLLDTDEVLGDAARLYRQYGFYEIECYNDNPMETAVYMKLDL